MAKKLSITIAGAVSLGCYEAGVLYEIVTALAAHNNDPATTPANRIEIDVITGASAGGMTATITAQKLLYEADSLVNPYNNSLYRPWVKDISLDGLLNLNNSENSTHSMLSSDLIHDISKKHLTLRYKSPVPVTAKPHAAAASSIRLGLAMSNLNGVDYQRTIQPNGQFVYTCYQDQMTKQLTPAEDTLTVWETLRQAAVSCGAFPFAFRTVDVTRSETEYSDPHLVPFASVVRDFTYTDGGVFQNEPLGMAKSLVDLNDPAHTESENRYYLFVSPGAKEGSSNSKFRESLADFGTTTKQLVGAIFQQARFQDWIHAEKINDAVRLFDSQALGLQQKLLQDQVTAASLAPAAQALLPLLFSHKPADQGPAWNRLRNQFGKEYAVLQASKGQIAADTWIDSILVFETAANLGDKDEMRIYGITATEKELACSKLTAFLGFFDQSYRDHDYDVGRTRARDIIDRINVSGDPIGPIHYKAVGDRSDIRPIDHRLDGLELKNVSADLRKRFKTRLTERAHDLMAEIGIPTALIREAIDQAFITPKLNKWLGL